MTLSLFPVMDDDDRRWLDARIVAIDDGIGAVLDIAANWTEGRNLSRLFPGMSAQEYVLDHVKHPLGRGVVVPLLAESNWSNRQIAAVAGVDRETVARQLAALPPVERPDKTLGADGKLRHFDPTPEIVIVLDPADAAILERVRAGETVVLNLRSQGALVETATLDGLYVRIDRRTDWGNPFEMPDDGDRSTVIQHYRDHYLPFKPSLAERLDELRGKALGCWCAPEPCHGDVLIEALR